MNSAFLIKKILLYLALSVAAITFIYPFLWMIGASFASMQEIGKMNLWPDHPSWKNFETMIGKIPIWRSLFNSLLVAVFTTSLVIFTGSVVGYALAKMRFKGRQLIFYIIVFTMSLPFQVTLIPNYITIVNLKLVDTYAGLIIPFAVSAFAILMFRQAFQGLPQALIDAALKTQYLLPDPKPFVLQTGLEDFYVSYQINAYTREANKQADIYSELHQNIQDVCNERGIEIMSPHYKAARDGNTTTIPSGYLPKDYQSPGFNININKKDDPSSEK